MTEPIATHDKLLPTFDEWYEAKYGSEFVPLEGELFQKFMGRLATSMRDYILEMVQLPNKPSYNGKPC